MRKSKGEHATPHSSRTLDRVVVSRGYATAPSSAKPPPHKIAPLALRDSAGTPEVPAHALSGARLHTPLDLPI